LKREALKASPGLAKGLKDTFSRTRSPCSWLGSADIDIYIYMENSMENPFFAHQFLRDNPQGFFHTAWELGFDQQLPT
jgi:hypothetical protein